MLCGSFWYVLVTTCPLIGWPVLLAAVPTPCLMFLVGLALACWGRFLMTVAAMYPLEFSGRLAALIGASAMFYPAALVAGRSFGLTPLLEHWDLLDRKSTRLNSSH